MKPVGRGSPGFSLIEVVMAVGILSVGVIAVMGLIGAVAAAAVRGAHEAEIAGMAHVAEAVLRERGFAGVAGLPEEESPWTLYLWTDGPAGEVPRIFSSTGPDLGDVWRQSRDELAGSVPPVAIYRASVMQARYPLPEWALPLIVRLDRLSAPGPGVDPDDVWAGGVVPTAIREFPVILRP